YREKGKSTSLWFAELGVGLARNRNLDNNDVEISAVNDLLLSPALHIGKEVFSGLELTLGVQMLIHVTGMEFSKVHPNVGINYVF
ncbi:MAG: hypothetical protein ACK5QT_11565, partial [Oligoflexia bacterium]